MATWWKRLHPRIAIEGQYLDKVQIRRAKRYPNSISCVSYVPYPCRAPLGTDRGQTRDRMRAGRSGCETLRRGIPPAVDGRDVVIEVGGEKIGRCLLEAVESGEWNGLDDVIVLRFRRRSEARA